MKGTTDDLVEMRCLSRHRNIHMKPVGKSRSGCKKWCCRHKTSSILHVRHLALDWRVQPQMTTLTSRHARPRTQRETSSELHCSTELRKVDEGKRSIFIEHCCSEMKQMVCRVPMASEWWCPLPQHDLPQNKPVNRATGKIVVKILLHQLPCRIRVTSFL